jgi:hypothetical protein
MAREFTRNMFIMLLSIMIGAIIITYFVADIVYQSNIRTLKETHTIEIETIEERNINFTSHFIESLVLLDKSRDDRALGNYHFDLAILWYNSALSEKNSSTMELYKNRTIGNCTDAMPNYLNSHQNFKTAKSFFNATKAYTTYEKYLELLDLYVNLTRSGARLTMLRYNASKYLKYMAENLTMVNETVTYLVNISGLMEKFNENTTLYGGESETYDEYQDEIDKYELLPEQR